MRGLHVYMALSLLLAGCAATVPTGVKDGADEARTKSRPRPVASVLPKGPESGLVATGGNNLVAAGAGNLVAAGAGNLAGTAQGKAAAAPGSNGAGLAGAPSADMTSRSPSAAMVGAPSAAAPMAAPSAAAGTSGTGLIGVDGTNNTSKKPAGGGGDTGVKPPTDDELEPGEDPAATAPVATPTPKPET